MRYIHLDLTGMAAAWAGMLVLDSIVFGMTLYKSIAFPPLNGLSIVGILLRDGGPHLPGTGIFLMLKHI